MTTSHGIGPAHRQPRWRLAFLVANARSGSTYLSRIIHRGLLDVDVPPEIDLLPALSLGESDVSASQAREALETGRFFEALDADPGGFRVRFEGEFKSDLAAAIQGYVDEYGAGVLPGGGVVVMKKGTHARRHRQIVEWFPEATFVCLHRDPRAVYESKRRTVRPYHPGETMAWMGVYGAAHRWRQYAEAMLEIEKVHGAPRVTYEGLMAGEEGVLHELANYWQVAPPRAPDDAAEDDYRIPEAERAIHSGAASGTVNQDKRAAWRTELTQAEAWVTEWVTRKPMSKLGYQREVAASYRGPWWLVKAALLSAGRLLRRLLRRKSVSR